MRASIVMVVCVAVIMETKAAWTQQPGPARPAMPQPGVSAGQAAAAPQPAVPAAKPSVPAAEPAVVLPAVAATVNGQPIPEVAIQRSLRTVPPDKHEQARPEILQFLIDNVLIQQFLAQQRLPVSDAEVEAKLKEVKDEISKHKADYQKILKDFLLTEEELRTQIQTQLRWDKYVDSLATDATLRELFEKDREMFDGTTVRARHLLVKPHPDPAIDLKQRQDLAALKQTIETETAEKLAKLPPFKDPLERERARARILEELFATAAAQRSDCPSKDQGGDLGYFPRVGTMVEPFSKAAFATKPQQLTSVVTTQFGHHLILVTDRKPGKDVKFEDVKDIAREVFGERLRADLAGKLRAQSKISLAAQPRP
jgi:peptidyl-prolyl cis-trans isomerase C